MAPEVCRSRSRRCSVFPFMAYNNGEGVEKDLEVAVGWLNTALAQGNEKAIEVAKKVKGL